MCPTRSKWKGLTVGELADRLLTPPFNEEEFQKGIRATDWYNEYIQQYGEGPDLRPMSDDPRKGPNYDYRAAWARGVRPNYRDPNDGQLHWASSAGGQMLKSESHPTFWKEGFMRRHGVNPDSLGFVGVKK